MNATPTPKQAPGREADRRKAGGEPAPAARRPVAEAPGVQTLHDAVEAARRFGLVRENY